MALPSGAEIAAALRGLGLILRGDARAMACFDLSLDGFWRSFIAPALVAVPFLLLLADAGAAGSPDFAALLLRHGVAWLGYLLLMAAVCRVFGLTGRYGAFVVLYNWAQALFTTALLAGWLLGLGIGLLLPGEAPASPPLMAELSFMVWLGSLYAVIQIARLSLLAGWSIALAAAVLDLIVSYLSLLL